MKIFLEEEERADAEAKEGEGDVEVLHIPKMTQMMKISTLDKSKITCYNFQKLGHHPNKFKLPNKNKLNKDKEKGKPSRGRKKRNDTSYGSRRNQLRSFASRYYSI